jgi:hypothetical protein
MKVWEYFAFCRPGGCALVAASKGNLQEHVQGGFAMENLGSNAHELFFDM